jgi:Flp pilus assembly pilin Flp
MSPVARLRRFLSEDDGAALLEYGMLLLLVALLCVVAVKALGSKVSNSFSVANSSLP